MTGDAYGLAALDVSGAITNDGQIDIATDFDELAGAVAGSGVFTLSASTIEFGSSVASSVTVDDASAGYAANIGFDEIVLASAPPVCGNDR